uniref:LmbE-like protein n=1 Tax=Rheinheimera sp. BAL341 TaxID=1708203 RepID=A0A486XWD1_9GAMM
MNVDNSYSAKQVQQRDAIITAVQNEFGFDTTTILPFCPARLDGVESKAFISHLKAVVDNIKPDVIYLPFAFDVHSDHQVVFKAMISACKSFRAPYVKEILCYETLSETNFALSPQNLQFQPNVFVDISAFVEKKYAILSLYASEFAEHPFPRSMQAVRALETLRGSQANSLAAEAFVLLKQIW